MNVSIMTFCPFCGKINFIEVSAEAYEEYLNGAYIQDAFPNLSADEREAIKTGICSDCWENMFPSKEEEEEEEPEEFDYDFADTYCEIGFNPYMGCYDWDE